MTAPVERTAHETGTGPGTSPDRRGPWRRGPLIAAAAVPLTLFMAGHTWFPDGFGNLGSLLETFLPWLGVSVPVLLASAAVRRSATAAVAALLPAVVWCSLFGGLLVDKRSAGQDLTVVSHNVNDENPSPVGTARELAASGAELLALEELSTRTAPVYERVLADTYPYHSVQGTVGLWSTYPLRDVEPVAIMPWTRALRATAETPKGPVAVYAAHLASVRVLPGVGFTTARRNEAAAQLADAVRAERLPRVVVVGDFNGTTDDRALRQVTSGLRSAQEEAGDGFGFSWPSSFPVARIDQILVRGVTPVSSGTLPSTGSDHLPVTAGLRL
ncbi:endonuclease/exonuclease/phosphatase family protein [Streptomyces sp. NPDC004728]|uniref:endonuclease/exonuclease/phosphatase family protein n=1 Tax=Streptomyces sp. NPDC004728 TaxID=3154289 RepID=UPI0033BC4C5C